MHEAFLCVHLLIQDVIKLLFEAESVDDLTVFVQNNSCLLLWAQDLASLQVLYESFPWGQLLRVHVLEPTLLHLDFLFDLNEDSLV